MQPWDRMLEPLRPLQCSQSNIVAVLPEEEVYCVIVSSHVCLCVCFYFIFVCLPYQVFTVCSIHINFC